MYFLSLRMARSFALALTLAAVTGCALPRFGPSKEEVFDIEGGINTEVVIVDDFVARATARPVTGGFPKGLLGGGSFGPDVIRAGDTLSFTIYENVDEGVLSKNDQGTSNLSAIQVDEDGFVFFPYAGRVRAAGNTPEALRRVITDKLRELTPEPQVLVQRATGDAATVSILGNGIQSQGVYPLRRSSRRLMEMLATAGGISVPTEVARITVVRRNLKGEIWFDDIASNPDYDIALQAGDRVLVQRDPRVFTALGAVGTQSNVPFSMRRLSALEALAQVGGLDSNVADPTGLFILRNEDANTTAKVLRRGMNEQRTTIIYVLDLTKPTGLPLARNFDMRDGDTLYVTEAPFIRWNKALSALVGTTSSVRDVAAIGVGG